MGTMKCRTYIEDNGTKNIVWFGSYGKNPDGTAKKISNQQVESNFSIDAKAVADSLTEKLHVMRGELWHAIQFGLPLLDKVKSKALIDTTVAQIVSEQSNVVEILSFSSQVINKEYKCDISVMTKFGNIKISL